MDGKIYLIRNDVNDRVYVGQTKRSIEKRFQEHTTLTEAKRSLVLARAIQKYGADKFHVELLQDGLTSTEALDAAEIRYIKEFGSLAPNGYNVTEGGLGHDPLVVDEALVLDYLSGLSIRAVAEKHGCSASKVKKHVLASGNKMRTNNNKFSAHASSLSEETLRDLFEVQGLTDSEISEKLGFSMRWIRRKRQQFGIHRI
jgi:group I intron endonuclease